MVQSLIEFPALDWLSSAVLIVDAQGAVVHSNMAAEALLDRSRRHLRGLPLAEVLGASADLRLAFEQAVQQQFADKRLVIEVPRPRLGDASLNVTVVPLLGQPWPVLLELREIDQQLRAERDARFSEQARENRELVRSLAHEIKNPLGGLRGAAQLLEAELHDASLREYTQVIIQESDRLQTLLDRMLEPHRMPHSMDPLNIHEVFERVRALVLAEYPRGLKIVRDYDVSAPEALGDKAQLIQVFLNIVHNAAQVLRQRRQVDDAEIILRSRVVRQVTLHQRHCRLALDLHVIDNGPGVPESLRDRIFFPLVSGREGGTGLGLTLAQTFVQQHGGVIECESQPGRTDFRVLLPLI